MHSLSDRILFLVRHILNIEKELISNDVAKLLDNFHTDRSKYLKEQHSDSWHELVEMVKTKDGMENGSVPKLVKKIEEKISECDKQLDILSKQPYEKIRWDVETLTKKKENFINVRNTIEELSKEITE